MGRYAPWLKAVLGIEAKYHVVHNLVRYKLKAKLKVPRPPREEQEPQAIETFKKNSLMTCSGSGITASVTCLNLSQFGTGVKTKLV